MVDRYDEMAREHVSMVLSPTYGRQAYVHQAMCEDAIAALLRKVHDEAIEAAARNVEVSGIGKSESTGDEIRKLKAGGK